MSEVRGRVRLVRTPRIWTGHEAPISPSEVGGFVFLAPGRPSAQAAALGARGPAVALAASGADEPGGLSARRRLPGEGAQLLAVVVHIERHFVSAVEVPAVS